MTTIFHSPIVTGETNAPSTINSRLAALDAAISVVSGAGGTFTLANGAAAAGQAVIIVDSSSGLVAGASVVYTLVGGVIETKVISAINSATQITLTTNIGTGGIPDNGVIAQVSPDAAAIGASVNRSGSLTAAQAVQYAAGDVHNALAYGMVAGGSAATNATALQAAIDAAGAAGGGTVIIPKGLYDISSTITLNDTDHHGVRIEGGGGYGQSGEGTVLKFTLGAAGYGISVVGTNSSSRVRDVTISNLRILWGANATRGISVNYGIVTIRDVVVQGGFTDRAVSLEQWWYSRIDNLRVAANSTVGIGVFFGGNANTCAVDGVHVTSAIEGIRISGARGCAFANMSAESSQQNGLYIRDARGCLIHGYYGEKNGAATNDTYYDLYVAGSGSYDVDGLDIRGMYTDPNGATNNSKGAIFLSGCKHVSISGGHFQSHISHTIRLDNTGGLYPSDVIIGPNHRSSSIVYVSDPIGVSSVVDPGWNIIDNVSVDYEATNPGATAETTLKTTVIPLGTVPVGNGIRVSVAGYTTGATSTKTIRVRFGATGSEQSLIASTTGGAAASEFWIECEIFRTGTATERAINRAINGAVAGVDFASDSSLTVNMDTTAANVLVQASRANAADNIFITMLSVTPINRF